MLGAKKDTFSCDTNQLSTSLDVTKTSLAAAYAHLRQVTIDLKWVKEKLREKCIQCFGEDNVRLEENLIIINFDPEQLPDSQILTNAFSDLIKVIIDNSPEQKSYLSLRTSIVFSCAEI